MVLGLMLLILQVENLRLCDLLRARWPDLWRTKPQAVFFPCYREFRGFYYKPSGARLAGVKIQPLS